MTAPARMMRVATMIIIVIIMLMISITSALTNNSNSNSNSQIIINGSIGTSSTDEEQLGLRPAFPLELGPLPALFGLPALAERKAAAG